MDFKENPTGFFFNDAGHYCISFPSGDHVFPILKSSVLEEDCEFPDLIYFYSSFPPPTFPSGGLFTFTLSLISY
jgi:hypothetical protein